MTVSDIAQATRAHDLLSRLNAAATGDRRAVHALIAECRPAVARFAAARGSSEPEVIADTVMMELLGRLDQLEFATTNHLWAYLYRIARSRVVDEQRRRLSECPVGDGHSNERTDENTAFEHAVVERLWVGEILADLTDDQREILELRFIDDLSIEETANRTGRTLTAVKALQRRAIRAVAAGLVALVALVAYTMGAGPERPAVTVSSSSEGAPTSVTTATTPDAIDAADPADADGNSAGLDASATVSTLPNVIGEELSGASSKGPATTIGEPVAENPGPAGGAGEVAGPVHPSDEGPVHRCMGVEGTVAALEAEGYLVVIGTEGDDVIDVSGDSRPAFVLGRNGHDQITTGNGDDRICGGPGNDTIRSGAGDDRVSGDKGNDRIFGGPGNDTLRGGEGEDRLFGGPGDDRLFGDAGNDVLQGGGGTDDRCDLGLGALTTSPETTDDRATTTTGEADAESADATCETVLAIGGATTGTP